MALPGTAKGRATGWRWDWMRARNGTETDGDAVLLCLHAGRREPHGKKRGKKKRGQHHASPQGDRTEKDLWLGPRDGPRGLGQHGRRHRREGRGQEGSDPCEAHKADPRWMRIQWARATGLLAARWGISTG